MKPKDQDLELAAIDLDAVPAFYEEPAAAARDVEIGLEADRVHIRRPARRRAFNALHVANLAKALERLPAAGETWHIVCKGNWPAWAMVPRAIELAAAGGQGQRVRWLGIATLGFSRDNADELLGLLDDGTVARADLLYSCYFKTNEDTLTSYLEHAIRQRGQRCKAIRTHAKIIAMDLETTAGPAALVVESSANLRSCRNVEQFTITNDAGLLAFHRDWIDQLVR